MIKVKDLNFNSFFIIYFLIIYFTNNIKLVNPNVNYTLYISDQNIKLMLRTIYVIILKDSLNCIYELGTATFT
tara:strand:+ start:1789 stop:2007 length:219 start_codon:yes stop_codon:yes gene_type:complete